MPSALYLGVNTDTEEKNASPDDVNVPVRTQRIQCQEFRYASQIIDCGTISRATSRVFSQKYED